MGQIAEGGENQRKYFWILSTLLLLFFFRVAGQIIVYYFPANGFLPVMDEWYSGLMPYYLLLPSQIIILLVFGRICYRFSPFSRSLPAPSIRWGKFLLTVGFVYIAIMITRYTIRMSLYPSERWIGGSIPILFHIVLASYLLALGAYHYRYSTKLHYHRESGWSRLAKVLIVVVGFCTYLLWISYLLCGYLFSVYLGIKPGNNAVRISRQVDQVMSDQVKLRSDVYRPYRIAKTPTVLIRLPYNKSYINKLFATIVGRFIAEHGYTVVVQGTRGRYDSEGVYYPLRIEREDGLATLRWLSKQNWFNGKIAMWGGSYFGYTQWVLADAREPQIDAMCIQLASTSFYSMFYPGGAFSYASALFWAVNSSVNFDYNPTIKQLKQGYDGSPLIEADVRSTGSTISFFRDWANHQTNDPYWQQIDGHNRVAALAAPVFLMAGWFDPFLPSELSDYIQIRKLGIQSIVANSHLVIGPWGHARLVALPNASQPTRPYRIESLAMIVPWFDSLFKGVNTTAMAPVRIYVMGINQWRDEQEWPLKRTQYKKLYLHAAQKGTLDWQASGAKEQPYHYIYDPKHPVPSFGGAILGPESGMFSQNKIEARDDVLVYSTEKLIEPIEVTGPIKLHLTVSSDANCTDFTARLLDVYPDGTAYNLSEGIIRLRQLQQGKHGIDIDLWPTSNVFLKDHQIRLEVSSSNYPRFDKNTNICGDLASMTISKTAKQSVYHAGPQASFMTLPIIPSKFSVSVPH